MVTTDEAISRARCVFGTPIAEDQSVRVLQLGGLETRILFSATPIDIATLPGADDAAMVMTVDTVSASELETAAIKSLAETQQADAQPSELIFVDSAVPDIEQLLDDLGNSGRGQQVFVLDPRRNGVDQITEILDSETEVDSIHVISHARAGSVKLGNAWLSQSSLSGHAGQIASWQSAMSSDADILFYGCDLAGSASGQTLLDSIASLTGSDVAASTDDTGHSDLGGDWEFEYSRGVIEATSVFSQRLEAEWRAVLSGAAPTVTPTAAFLNYTENDPATFVDSGVTITDPDDLVLAGAEIRFAAGYVSGQDLLEFTDQLGITHTWDSALGALILSGNSSVANYETALRSITYRNTSETPDESLRMFNIQVSDGTQSSVGARMMTVTAVNDRPVLNGIAGDSLGYVTGSGAAVIEQGLDVTVGDLDSIDFDTGNLKVSIFSGGDISEDVLSIRNQGMSLGQIGFDGSNVYWGGTLIGTASGGTSGAPLIVSFNASATKIATAALVRNVTYENLDAVAPTAGTRTVRFVVDDGDGDASLDHDASVVVTASNSPPTDIDPDSFSVDENIDTTTGFRVGVLTASDPDAGEMFSYSIVGGTDQLKFTIGGSNDDELILADGILDFERQNTYFVRVRVTDSALQIYEETLTVGVNDRNDNAPEITLGQSFNVSEFATNGTSLGFVAATDADAGTTLGNWTISSGNDDGIFVIDVNSGELSVLDNTNLNYESSNTYVLDISVSDGLNTSPAGAIQINVTDENDLPVAVDDVHSGINEGATHVRGVPGVLLNDSDEDIDTLTAILISGPAHAATFTLNADGSYTYQHDGSETTTDAFTYQVSDGTSVSNVATVTLTVTPENDAPTDITLDNSSVLENSAGAFIGNLAVLDPDPGDTHAWSVDDIRFEVIGTQLKLKSGESLDYETASTVTLIVSAIDQAGTGLRFDKSIAIAVANVNEAPVTAPDKFFVTEGNVLSIPASGVLADDSDPEGDAITASLLVGPAHGTLILLADGSFQYTPDGSFIGADTFAYAASDGSLASGATLVTIQVSPPKVLAPLPPPTTEADPDPKTTDDPDEETDDDDEREVAKFPPETGGPSAPNRGKTTVRIPNTYVPDVPWQGAFDSRNAPGDGQIDSELLVALPGWQVDVQSETRVASLRSAIQRLVPFGSAVHHVLMSGPGVLWNELDEHTERVESHIHRDLIIVGAAGAAASSLTVGVVTWSLRTGFVASGLLAQIPAWRGVDPLLIMQGSVDNEDFETLEQLMKRQQQTLDNELPA